ncbi:ATP-binding cassette domain-containing protein [Magnetovibrio sp. PR-2]|uniref:ABC transporter ATP-binding protein n=1 Tax=Magnetovibrio sp. PR-2 TaxID=3120356 RepID=UPI002FCE0A32
MLSVKNLQRLSIGPIDLDVEAGARVVLRGPSGAGKSLLLRAIADLDPNAGDVSLNGEPRDTMDAPIWRARVMYVPAAPGWWADTVRPHFEGLSHSAVKDILHRVSLESTALDWQTVNLSTGERQRLALARAVARDPEVLLLDEPTSGLDPDNVDRVERLISELSDAGKAIVFVSHDPAQAQRLATRHVELKDGQLSEVTP